MTNPDPRARQLAETMHRLVREKATKLPEWKDLPLSFREQAVTEARLWLRAVIAAGIARDAEIPRRLDVGTEFVQQADHPDQAGTAAFETDLAGQAGSACTFEEGCHRFVPCDPGCAVTSAELHRRMAMATPDRTALRDRIAAAVDEGFRLYAELEDTSLGGSITDSVLTAVQTTVLSVLPAAADRATVLREAADAVAALDRRKLGIAADTIRDAWEEGRDEGADELRRLADEAQQTETEPPVHLGDKANAERCPACKAEHRNLPYPFLCPAVPGAAATRAKEA
ncbi:hypothetical protein [Streptomyces sp. NPDC008092]|uniref:hypothetical protein n=1 Tax=Streptomyces sp. NPDC008092 TaxID=3364808 RepID=UPI0036E1F7B5